VWRIHDGRPLARLGLEQAAHADLREVIPASSAGNSGAGSSFVRAEHRCISSCFASWPQRGTFLVTVLAPEKGNVGVVSGSPAVTDCRQEYKVVLYDWQGLDTKLSLSNGLVGYEGAGINSIVTCCDCPIHHHLGRDIVTRYVNGAVVISSTCVHSGLQTSRSACDYY
jgi:hypothetical protein